MARNTAEARARGYRHIKLHELTREAVLAAKAAAPDAAVMLDVNCAWTPPVARGKAAAMAGEGLLWLEEPVWPPEDTAGLASLRRYGIPLSAGENTAGLLGFRALIEAGAIDVAQRSVTKVGGVGEMKRVIALAQAHGVEVVPHSPKPRRLVIDGLRRYGVARREILPEVRHRASRYLNNRAGSSHRPTRRQERGTGDAQLEAVDLRRPGGEGPAHHLDPPGRHHGTSGQRSTASPRAASSAKILAAVGVRSVPPARSQPERRTYHHHLPRRPTTESTKPSICVTCA